MDNENPNTPPPTDENQVANPPMEDDDMDQSLAEIELRPHIINNQALLDSLDGGKKLQIWCKRLQSDDQLVTEYIQLLEKTKFFPLPPSPEELTEASIIPNELKSDKETQVKVLNILSAFLTNTYHLDNVKNALQRDLPLFVPKAKFMVPNYSHLPLSYFEGVRQCKEFFACAIQLESIHAVMFTNELFLLRAFNELQKDLQEKTCSRDHMKYELKVLFSVAGRNFKKEHKTKVIDWDTKESKVHGSMPAWRKKKEAPPTIVRNKYAEKLSKAILSSTVNLTTPTRHEDLNKFLESSRTPSVPPPPPPPKPHKNKMQQQQSCHQQQPPPPQSSQQPQQPQQSPFLFQNTQKSSTPHQRLAAKAYDNLFKRKPVPRKGNPEIMKRRGLDIPMDNPEANAA